MELLKKLKELINESDDLVVSCLEEMNGYRINTKNGAVIHCYKTGNVLFQETVNISV